MTGLNRICIVLHPPARTMININRKHQTKQFAHNYVLSFRHYVFDVQPGYTVRSFVRQKLTIKTCWPFLKAVYSKLYLMQIGASHLQRTVMKYNLTYIYPKPRRRVTMYAYFHHSSPRENVTRELKVYGEHG